MSSLLCPYFLLLLASQLCPLAMSSLSLEKTSLKKLSSNNSGRTPITPPSPLNGKQITPMPSRTLRPSEISCAYLVSSPQRKLSSRETFPSLDSRRSVPFCSEEVQPVAWKKHTIRALCRAWNADGWEPLVRKFLEKCCQQNVFFLLTS